MKHLTAISLLLGFILTLITLSLPHPAAAQKKQGQARLDSLLAEAPKMADDTAVKLMRDISFEYGTNNPGERLKWAERH